MDNQICSQMIMKVNGKNGVKDGFWIVSHGNDLSP